MNKLLRIVVCAGLLLLTPPVFGGIPPTINYQGYLTSGLGVPVNVGVPMVFRLYSAPTGATLLWTESRASVTVTNGNFNVALGSVTPLDLNFDVPYWLTVEIGTDGEMSPRQALSSVPYAVIASELDSGAQVAGSQIVGTISMANIAGSQITGTIGTATIGGSQVTGAITTATIGGSQITGNIAAAGDIVAAGNLFLPNSTASVGRIRFGSSPFIHNYGTVNTFVGEDAGNFTLAGSGNTALGAQSMQGITSGFNNAAAGLQALRANTSGFQNSAFGSLALLANVGGSNNSALGNDALKNNIGGGANTAAGRTALFSNVAGSNNAAFGFNALYNATGSDNIAIGSDAGSLVTSGSNNIHIGHVGSAGDSNTIRIGYGGNPIYIPAMRGASITGGVEVVVGTDGRLGQISSSRALKDTITDMGTASETLMRLRPVTFHYKALSASGERPLQYGLIAEEVAAIAPELVARSAEGKIETVFYRQLPPMLLNEYQKQQRTIQAQALAIQRQEADLLAQRTRVEVLERQLRAIQALLVSR